MGWFPIDRDVQRLCDQVGANPVEVRDNALQLLDDNRNDHYPLRPSDRLRLLGLLIAASRKLGELDQAEAAATEGLMITAKSPIANADFLLQLAPLRIVQQRTKEALQVVHRAKLLMLRELDKPEPTARESQRRRRWIRTAVASAHVTRGEIFLFLSEGTIDQTFADTLKALDLTSDLVRASAYTRRVHLAAVTLLCVLLVRFGSQKLVQRALELLNHAERILIYRCRVPPDHVHRIKIRWGRALALARMGFYSRAETLLIRVIEQLIEQGHKSDAEYALDALVWVVEQTSMPARAGYYALKYGSNHQVERLSSPNIT